MGRPATGMVDLEPLADGTANVVARFRHEGERLHLTFGNEVDGWNKKRGRRELDDVLAQLRAGIPLEQIVERYRPKKRPAAETATTIGVLFHEYASRWLARRRIGEIGDAPLSAKTYADYLWRLVKYVLPYFAEMPVASIGPDDCRAFRAQLLANAAELRTLIEAGAEPRDSQGRRRRPLGPAAIRKQMALLAQILDEAIEDGLRPENDNPARSKRLRVRVPKPNRSFLEIDQLAAIIDAAGELQDQPRTRSRAKLTMEQAEEIRGRLRDGETQKALAHEYGLSKGGMSMLANGKTYRADRGDRVGWQALCAMLGYAGPRISEALALRERDVRLHDPRQSRLWVADSKTETGVRHVEVTPRLRAFLLKHRAEKARHGYPCGPDDPFFCTRSGSAWDADNVRPSIVEAAAALASARMVDEGLPPLPHVTPHTLRRTYVSIMLLATDFDVPFVQRQVGHADSKMTMDVYAQLLDRSKRQHGEAFDALLDDARDTLGAGASARFSQTFSQMAHGRSRRSEHPTTAIPHQLRRSGEARDRVRTGDLLRGRQTLYQLSYSRETSDLARSVGGVSVAGWLPGNHSATRGSRRAWRARRMPGTPPVRCRP